MTTYKNCIIKNVDILGMPLQEWIYKSCTAHIAEGENWATLYDIQSEEKGKGHASHLLLSAKEYFKNKKFGGTVALNSCMKRLYKKLGIYEYE